ncbi:MAG: DUF6491 family protein [Pseudomonadales bacterium]
MISLHKLFAGTLPGYCMAIALGGLLLGIASVAAAQEPAAAAAAVTPEPPAASAPSKRAPLPSLDELLERDSADPDEYTERCLTTRRIRTHRVLDPQHLVFEMRGGEHFLVQFPRRCFGLRRGDPISYRTTSGKLCRLDSIRPLEFRGRGLEPGIPCNIPNFQRVTEEQIDYLVTALKAQRQRR